MGLQGIINLLKPAGMTSHDAVYFLRKLTGEKKIGHTGTLDPMAAGVLPLCIGNATRIIDYLDLDDKEYRCELLLGLKTDTWDIWGTKAKDNRHHTADLDEKEINRVLQTFSGEIFQIPPMYSSVRINGKHLYEYARKDQEIEVHPRPVVIYSIEVVAFDRAGGRVIFDVRCSKGTYIRSICHEAGIALGCGASMSFLVRKASGTFRIENAATLEELKDDWKKYLLPADYPLVHFGCLQIPEKRVEWFSNGGSLRLDEVKVTREPSVRRVPEHIRTRAGLQRAYGVYCGERFLGVMLYEKDKKQFIADKVFCR